MAQDQDADTRGLGERTDVLDQGVGLDQVLVQEQERITARPRTSATTAAEALTRPIKTAPTAFEVGNNGYDGRYVREDDYNHCFREDFQRGHEDGYCSRRYYGSTAVSNSLKDNALRSVLDLESLQKLRLQRRQPNPPASDAHCTIAMPNIRVSRAAPFIATCRGSER